MFFMKSSGRGGTNQNDRLRPVPPLCELRRVGMGWTWSKGKEFSWKVLVCLDDHFWFKSMAVYVWYACIYVRPYLLINNIYILIHRIMQI